MIEKSVITHRLSALEEYLTDLGEINKDLDRTKFKDNKIIRRYVERTLQVATEACLDIANHIISYEGYREPEDNKDVFKVLSEKYYYRSRFERQANQNGKISQRAST